MKPSSMVGCNSYGLIFPLKLEQRAHVGYFSPGERDLICARESNELDGNRTKPRLGVIQE